MIKLRKTKIKNELILKSHLSNIKSLIDKKEWNAIKKYLKILSQEYNFKIAKKCLENKYYNNLPDFVEGFVFYNLCKETKIEIDKHYFGAESFLALNDPNNIKINYNFLNHPILLGPWNSSRIIKNLININQNNILSADKGQYNIYNDYYFPMDLILCCGGNHSQLSAILEGNGESVITTIFDIRPLYKKIKFDGNDFVLLENNKVIPVTKSKRENILEAKYLLGIYFEIGRLLINHKEYFPDYITKHLNKF